MQKGRESLWIPGFFSFILRHMFDVIKPQLVNVTEKLAHLRRFL
jgi:hypothetical protein